MIIFPEQKEESARTYLLKQSVEVTFWCSIFIVFSTSNLYIKGSSIPAMPRKRSDNEPESQPFSQAIQPSPSPSCCGWDAILIRITSEPFSSILTYFSVAVQLLAPAFQVSQSRINNASNETQTLVITHLSQYKLHLGVLLMMWEDHLLLPPTTASGSIGSN